jgi:hypothetical protein
MKGISDINALIAELVEIDNQERKLEDLIKAIRKRVIDDLTNPNFKKD